MPGVQRLTVKVRRVGELGATAAQGKDQSAEQEWLATTIGFRGTALSGASGEQPDWNGARVNPGGRAGGGGRGGNGTGSGDGGGPPNTGGPGGRLTDPPVGTPR